MKLPLVYIHFLLFCLQKQKNINIFAPTKYKNSMTKCPYCNRTPLSEASCIIKEKGNKIESGNKANQAPYEVFYVRCCPSCLSRRKCMDKFLGWTLPAGPLLLLISLPFYLVNRYYTPLPEMLMKVVAYVMLAAFFVIFPLGIILHFMLPRLLNSTRHHKHRVTRQQAEAQQALAEPFTHSATSVEPSSGNKGNISVNNPRFYEGD